MTIPAPALDRQLVGDSFVADPYPVYALLRDESPVHWSAALDAWLVSRHDDAVSVLRDPARFSSFGWESAYLSRLPPAVRAAIPELLSHHRTPNIITADPPLHTRLRRSVGRGFTPRAIEPLRSRLTALCIELLAPGVHAGSLDVVADLAYPMPATAIAELLGVPSGDRDRFKAWSTSQTRFFGSPRPDPGLAGRADRDLREFRAWLRGLMEARRAAPQDDIISLLVQADDRGETLSDEEMLATLVIFLVAGHETTTNLIANGMLALLRHPGQLAELRDRPELMADAVEEMLRYDPPVQRVRRRATEDVELGGQVLRAGDTVMVLIASANRDPRSFERADTFDITRGRSAHLAFGAGIHSCVGAGLARLEAPIALGALLEAAPRLRIADGWTPRWNASLTLRGLRDLPVQLACGGTMRATRSPLAGRRGG